MTGEKEALEFTDTTAISWTAADPDIPGLDQKILASQGKEGVYTRLMRFAPGCDTSAAGVQRHDCWEEVYILEGAIHDLTLGQTFSAGHFACRPPGMAHGPWISEEGCLTFDVRYTR